MYIKHRSLILAIWKFWQLELVVKLVSIFPMEMERNMAGIQRE